MPDNDSIQPFVRWHPFPAGAIEVQTHKAREWKFLGRPHRLRIKLVCDPRRVPRGNAPIKPKYLADESSAFVELINLAIGFPFANQFCDRVCSRLEPASSGTEKLTGQCRTVGQGSDGDDAGISFGPLQLGAGVNVKFTGDLRGDDHLIPFADCRCHKQMLIHQLSQNKPQYQPLAG